MFGTLRISCFSPTTYHSLTFSVHKIKYYHVHCFAMSSLAQTTHTTHLNASFPVASRKAVTCFCNSSSKGNVMNFLTSGSPYIFSSSSSSTFFSDRIFRCTTHECTIRSAFAFHLRVRVFSSFASAAFRNRSKFSEDNCPIAAASSFQVHKLPESVPGAKHSYTSRRVSRPQGSNILCETVDVLCEDTPNTCTSYVLFSYLCCPV